jgi:hypothetical protein
LREKRDRFLQNTDEHMKRKKCEEELVIALSAVGLKLRPDSEICKRYINGEDKSLTQDHVVKVMESMHFLYQHTQYGRIVKYALDEAYSDAKQRIHSKYGYVSDYDEYQQLLKAYVNRKEISEKSQTQAVKEYVDAQCNISLLPTLLLQLVC